MKEDKLETPHYRLVNWTLTRAVWKSHWWQFWRNYAIVSQAVVPVIISWGLKAAMLVYFCSLTKHPWVIPSPKKKGNIVWQYEVCLSEKLVTPCHITVFSTGSLEAVSGDNCRVSVQLGCLHNNCPQQRCPTREGAQSFWGWNKFLLISEKLPFPLVR